MPLLNKTRVRSAAHNHPVGPAPAPVWTTARIALTAFFAVDGFLFAAWVVRIPDIRAQVDASHSALGLALLCLSAGAVATMPLIGRLCVRYGSRPVTVASLAALSLAVLLPAHTGSVLTLGAALLLFGAAYGAANVSMNSAAVDLVVELRRPVMPSFHAGYSLGGLLGAAVGGLLAGTLSTAWALALSGALGLLVTVVAGTALLRTAGTTAKPVTVATATATAKPPVRQPARNARLLVVLLGLVALCDAYGEGALADWATLHLTDDVQASASLAATGYAAFAFAMTAGRLGGTWLSVRAGQTRVMVIGGLTAAIGMLVAALSPAVPLVLAGFVLVGLGLANIFPLAIAAAGAAGGPQGVATASTLGYAGMLVGPPVIGFLADATTLPIALTTVAATATLAAALSLLVRPKPATR
ncbi:MULTISPECIES: MFS transporter [unclassified Kitasatospora]|uniref:MFS transporter n=1 Tax=unclassified Kitasatospora TaxID=2633591 RepID=UPI0007111BC1|nr:MULTISPECIES: MFS transporter [unclassified Kitasatospora]KQV16562.1 transporter [Kitasatospora sp. Root107]KRB71590.1 transporter [Kitasatospora sp. Root187]